MDMVDLLIPVILKNPGTDHLAPGTVAFTQREIYEGLYGSICAVCGVPQHYE